jgi:PIN domain nuclease of toxin-antitoxin system
MARLLLDTHVALALIDPEKFELSPSVMQTLESGQSLFLSSVSLWEIAIKHRWVNCRSRFR